MRQNHWLGPEHSMCFIFGMIFSSFCNLDLLMTSAKSLQIKKMDLEARSLQPNVKAVLLAKLREYKSDLNTLESEFKGINSAFPNQTLRDDLWESGTADAPTVCLYQHLPFHVYFINIIKYLENWIAVCHLKYFLMFEVLNLISISSIFRKLKFI